LVTAEQAVEKGFTVQVTDQMFNDWVASNPARCSIVLTVFPSASRYSYQQGSVQREKRQSGSDVWIFRWWESTFDGTSKRRKAIVGTVEAFPTEASALKAAKALRIDANQQTPHSEGGPVSASAQTVDWRGPLVR
jgi:hypothetical protein